jgi:hypothetical protein
VKISDIPVPNKRVMGKLAQDCIDVIQGDASKGKFQNGRSGLSYKSESYKRYKANSMRGKTGKKLKAFRNQATNTQTAYVDMNLTKRTLRSMKASSNKKNAIITYDRGEIVLGNQKRGYDIYDLSNKNQEFIADRFGKELLDRNIKKYVSKTTIIK